MHAVTGDVVIYQNNAWMDTIGVIMLIELVVRLCGVGTA